MSDWNKKQHLHRSKIYQEISLTKVECMTTSCRYCKDYICIKELIQIHDGNINNNWVHAECSSYKGRHNK